MTIPVTGKLSSIFDEPRPLSNPGLHIHGAWDISAPRGTPIVAPEPGKLYYAAIFREGKGDTWNELQGFPWKNYYYDVYGALTVLEGVSGLVHLFAHTYFNQQFNKQILPSSAWEYAEEKEDKRWPIHCMHTLNFPYHVQEKELIGYLGNAGYSSGPHVHYEVHHGWQLDDYEDRVNPALLGF